MEELDRVLDGHHVLGLRAVDLVDHRGERGGLARAGGARDEDDAALLHRQLGDHRREVELLDRADRVRDRAANERDHAALPEGVHAEAG